MRKKRIGSFFYVAMIVATICIITVAVMLSVLWSSLEAYENETPERAVQVFLSYALEGDSKTLMDSIGLKETEFFKASDYAQYMRQQLGNNPQEVEVIETSQEETGTTYHLTKKGSNGVEISLQKKQDGTGVFGKYAITQKMPEQSECTIVAPSFFKVKVNEVVLEKRHETTEVAVSQFETLKDTAKIPKAKTYQVKDLLNFPEITVENQAKEEYQAKRKGNTVTFTACPNAQDQKQLAQISEKAAIAYAKFISKDGEFKEYSQYVDQTSGYYKTVRNFDNSWYIDHESVAVENMKVDIPMAYSEDAFSMDVTFDYVVIKGRIRRVYATHYRIFYVKENNQFKIVNLELM